MVTTRASRKKEGPRLSSARDSVPASAPDDQALENLTQIDLVLKRHEDLLAMTFRRISDLQAEVDALRRQRVRTPSSGGTVRKS